MLKIIRKIYEVILSILILLVFSSIYVLNLNSINDVNDARLFYFLIITICILFFILIKVLIAGKYVIRINFIDASFIVFYIYSIVRILLKNPENLLNETMVLLLSNIVLFFIFKFKINYQDNSPFNVVFIILILLNGLIQSFWGSLQLLNLIPSNSDFFRITGSFNNPAPYTFYISIVYIFSLWIFFYYPGNCRQFKLIRILSVITCICILAILPFTKIRTAWLMTFAGSLIIIFCRYKPYRFFKKYFKNQYVKILIILILVVFIIVSIIALYKYKEQSADGRIFIWKVSGKIVAEHPLFGIGYDEFKKVYGSYQAEWFGQHKNANYETELADTINYTYNEFYQILIEGGIIGFNIFSIMLFFIFRKIRKLCRDYINIGAVLSALLLSILLCGLFSYPFRNISINLFFILVIALISKETGNDYLFKFQLTWSMKMIAALLIIFILLYSSFEEFKRLKGTILWYKVKNTKTDINGVYSEKIYSSIYPLLKNNGYFLCDYGDILQYRMKYIKSCEILNCAKNYYPDSYLYFTLGNVYTNLNDFKNAEKSYIHAINMSPNKLTAKCSLMLLYDQFGYKKEAEKAAKEILNFKVKVTSFYTRRYKEDAREILRKYKRKK